jgi:hypothetical protein
MSTIKVMIRLGSQNSDLIEANKILHAACELLECWVSDFEEQQQDDEHTCNLMENSADDNPFCTLLAQAKHRLGQIALLRGNLDLACMLFLQVILHDPHTLSPSALAMTLYDVGLIYLTYGRIPQAQAALRQSLTV